MKRKEKRTCKDVGFCNDCAHCIPAGEGDHICEKARYGDSLVIEEYMPTASYMWCHGRKYKPMEGGK